MYRSSFLYFSSSLKMVAHLSNSLVRLDSGPPVGNVCSVQRIYLKQKEQLLLCQIIYSTIKFLIFTMAMECNKTVNTPMMYAIPYLLNKTCASYLNPLTQNTLKGRASGLKTKWQPQNHISMLALIWMLILGPIRV